MAEEVSPLKRPGEIQPADTDDTLLAQGLRALNGALVLRDPITGTKTLAELAAGGGISPELEQAIAQSANTGVLTGLTTTINGGDPTTFDVDAGTANVFNAYTTPSVPTITPVSFAGVTGAARTTGGESPQATLTFLSLNSSGTIVQFADTITVEDTRDHTFFAILWHPEGDGNVIVAVTPFGETAQGAIHDLYDFRTIFGTLRTAGLLYTANGANQSLNRTAGALNGLGIDGFDSPTARKSPSESGKSAVVLANIFRTYRDATNGLITDGPTATWDPSVWDDGSGSLQAFPGPDNYGIARGYYGPGGAVVLGVPQKTYRTKEDALADLDHIIVERGFLTSSIPTTWCVFNKTATVFTNLVEAQFFEIPVLFRLGGGGGGSSSGAGVVTVRTASTVVTDPHTIRAPAAAVVLIENAGEATKLTAAFPTATDATSGSFSYLVKVGPLGGALTTVGTVTILQGEHEGEFTPVSAVAFDDGDAMVVDETAIGAFAGGTPTVEKRCSVSMRFTET